MKQSLILMIVLENKSEMLGPNMADKTAKIWNIWDVIWQQTLIHNH